jgi:uncharacterized Ntn-hydrolase superfamily protein
MSKPGFKGAIYLLNYSQWEFEMNNIRIFIIVLIACLFLSTHAQDNKSDIFTHTYSIVARDSTTGDMGVAVQSHWFSVGSVVSWAEAGVGAIATQSLVNISFGPRGLDLLREGKTAPEALNSLIKSDSGSEFRQVAIVDTFGNVATFTGKNCIPDAGQIIGKNYSVQANMMLNKKVWPAMSDAFENSTGPLAERMMEALKAAEAAGGDIRGQQSASILVVRGKATGKTWEDRLIDLRVEDHPQAVKEIERVLKVHRAYEHMNKGDLAIELGHEEKALKEYGAAEKLFPENIEMKYWHAVSLANIGKLDMALPMFKEVFEQEPNWIELTKRIVPNGLLKVDAQTLEKIINIQ